MNNRIKAAAKELHVLELARKTRVLSEEEQQKLIDLLDEVFIASADPDSHEHKRRSFRLPSKAKCTLVANDKQIECDLLDVSHVGLTLAGNAFAQNPDLNHFILDSVSLNGRLIKVGLKCTKVRSRQIDNMPGIGAQISKDNSPEANQRFFEDLYFPFYMDYLENLSKS